MSMYVRIKRQKVTLFIHCEPNETVQQLKEKVQAITSQDASNIKLKNAKDQDLIDTETLAAQQVKNDAELHMVYRLDNETWEPVDIHKPQYAQAEEDML